MLPDSGEMAKRKTTDYIQINVRMREALRAKLETSAKRNDESLNREIVDRLERSFDRQELLIDAMTLTYGEHLSGLLMVMARAMADAGKMGVFVSDPRSKANWWDVPFAYNEAAIAALIVLKSFRPPGEIGEVHPLAKQLSPKATEAVGGFAAHHLIEAVKGKAPPDLRKWASTVRSLLEPEEGET